MAYLSPLVTYFNFDKTPAIPRAANFPAWRGEAFLQLKDEPAIDELLTHLRFCFDAEWATYYHERCNSDHTRAAVLRSSLGCVAFDTPMLMAFFLLLGAKNLLPRQVARNERLNRARKIAGKPLLLEHVEVSAPVDAPRPSSHVPDSESMRSSPRWHHVRGHIAGTRHHRLLASPTRARQCQAGTGAKQDGGIVIGTYHHDSFVGRCAPVGAFANTLRNFAQHHVDWLFFCLKSIP
jgi:hypothetical protein